MFFLLQRFTSPVSCLSTGVLAQKLPSANWKLFPGSQLPFFLFPSLCLRGWDTHAGWEANWCVSQWQRAGTHILLMQCWLRGTGYKSALWDCGRVVSWLCNCEVLQGYEQQEWTYGKLEERSLSSGWLILWLRFFSPQVIQIFLLGWLPLGICKCWFGHCLRRSWKKSWVLWGEGLYFSVFLLLSFLHPCLTLRFVPKPGFHQCEVS